MDELAARRAERETHRRYLQAFKDEVTDWCHFELAIELACEKTGADQATMRRLACSPGVWS